MMVLARIARSVMSKKSRTTRSAVSTVEDYIQCFPAEVRRRLQQMRSTIRKVAPGAEERISYRVPAFFLNGPLVYFAAFENHIAFYPRASGIAKFKRKLSPYRSAKGSVRFPFDEPIPFKVITKIVKFRMKEDLERAKKDRKRKTRSAR